MGELFLSAGGEAGGFEKLCVVKKVLHSLRDHGVHRRFLDEAKVVVRLNHANLVQVFDAGRVDEEHYLAMELIEGKDLRAVWNRCAQLHRRIPVDFALFVAREVARGLSYVHDALGLNLVHRDISPPNILVGYHGQVKITDFGLAKHAIKRELTNPGVVFGRYSYLAPEQAKGQPADRRTDIYAVGIILWEMLTGRQLFPSDGRNPGVLKALRNPQTRPPSEVVPGVPDGVDEVVLRALAPDRDERYQNAGEFREDLSRVLARHYTRTDVDRVSALMQEIFAREFKLESADYAAFAREDFSPVRATARQDTETISIDDLEIELIEEEEPAEKRAARLHAEAEARVGSVVGDRYTLDALLGTGGMGAVYRVADVQTGAVFALKVLHTEYGSDPDLVARFEREARAASQTGHPHIIDVLDFGKTDDGDVYFVMENLEGVDLRGVIVEGGPMRPERAVSISRQICDALGAAHDAGIIHRDLKSENIMLTQRGSRADFVKVLDFGICKHVEDVADGGLTTPGMIMGSPDYMAPEQAAGAPADVKSDVYALGTILFEALTGRLPFEGRNAIDVLMKKGGRRAPTVLEYRPDCPETLAMLIADCLHRDLDRRPASMADLDFLLSRALEPGSEAQAEFHAARSGIHAAGALSSGSFSTTSASFQAASFSSEASLIASVTGSHPPSRMSSTARALFFVGLGGVVVGTGMWLALRGGDDAESAEVAAPVADPEVIVPTPVPAPTDGGASGDIDESAPPDADADPALAMEDDPVLEEDDADESGDGADPDAIAARAEGAFERGQWREPAQGSLALELANLSLADPGHEALSRLRRAVSKQLGPTARQQVRGKDWTDAAETYRDLFAVVPDYDEDARADFVKALRISGQQLRRAKDHDAALRTADELLNVKPGYFSALKLRADSLASLGRWEDAVSAYRAAMRARPKSKDAKKGYWRARAKLAKEKKE
jgi:serine/threonine protein kinase